MDNSPTLLAAHNRGVETKLLTLVSLGVVVAALYFGRQVFIPLASAVVLAFLLAPIVDVLERYHLGRTPSVLIVLALSFALLGLLGWGVTRQLMGMMTDLPDYQANMQAKIDAIRAPQTGALGQATATVTTLSKELASASETAGNKELGRTRNKAPIAVQVTAPPHTVAEYLRDIAGPITGVFETAGIVVIFTLFMLIKREDLRNRMIRLAGSGQLTMMTQALDDASRRLGRYLLMQFLVNASFGLSFGVGLYFIGVPNPLLWGVLAALLRFVPYIGTLVATAFPMMIAIAVFPGWSQVGFIFLLFLCLELTVANLIEPWLYGSHTGISSLAILVTAIFWATLWGPVGLILSTPLTVCLIVLGRYVPQLSFLEIILGDEPVLSPQDHYYQRLLALDDEEAREIAEQYLKTNPLISLYDLILIPALSLAGQDRQRNVLDENRANFIQQQTGELVEEFYEAPAGSIGAASSPSRVSSAIGAPEIVCLAARDTADEIVANMTMQMLRAEGQNAYVLGAGPISTILEQLEKLRPAVVCVSALPPFAAGQAKSICKQLHRRYPETKIVLGLWAFPGGSAKARERIGSGCGELIGTSLAEVIVQVNEAVSPAPDLISAEI